MGKIGESFLQSGDLFPQEAGDPDGDPGVGDQKLFDIVRVQPTDRGIFDGLGIVVGHALTDKDHLPEHRPGFENAQGEGLAVLGDPEHPYPSVFEDEQSGNRLALAENQFSRR